jgi:Prealbumin-like fold domain
MERKRMTVVHKGLHRRRRIGIFAALVAVAAGLVFALTASTASLPGSNFEIDASSNLKVDNPAPSIDWASVSEARQNDLPTGANDDSYSGGAKEDDACPTTTTGSIPNNKSDLLTFGAYVEPEANGPGFLNLFWRRVNDPSGTTLMDFELNHSGVACANGVNRVRTVGDLLLEYSIDQGGAVATITAREWSGSAWGPKTAIPNQALGTINQTPIPAAESDGLSSTPVAARTFGEMQLDLDFIFDEGKCESFGSAFVKSRSSDSFTSQLKDFIRPVPVNITNCGKVIIRKQTDPDEADNSTQFGYTKSFSTDPASANTFNLADDGVQEYPGVLIGSGYSVVENQIPAGWDFASLDCSASTGVSPNINGATVTFAIDNAADILDCTYTNRARGNIVIEKITDDGQGAFSYTSSTLTPSPFVLTTTGAGAANKGSRQFSDLAPGTYDAAETVPAGWNLVSSSCSDGSPVSAIALSGGETVTCTFHNARERGAILIQKFRKHAADGAGDHPQPGVDFTVSGGNLSSAIPATTNGQGLACVDGLVLSSFVGDYTVTESLPAGYHAAGALAKVVSVVAEGSCPSGPTANVSFLNIPLTDITIIVNSQVNGGTASSIDCDGVTGSTGPNGDGQVARQDLEPGLYHCEVLVDP